MKDITALALVYKAFCDGHRLHILDQLSLGERCACDLLEKVNIGQSTLSHHMKILVESGVVSARKMGKWTYYSLDQKGGINAVEELKRIMTLKESSANSCACE
jgi:ArsR family transcriptional regulator, arsenate/arsenite/antimonite-responsive transcriptional repressor